MSCSRPYATLFPESEEEATSSLRQDRLSRVPSQGPRGLQLPHVTSVCSDSLNPKSTGHGVVSWEFRDVVSRRIEL